MVGLIVDSMTGELLRVVVAPDVNSIAVHVNKGESLKIPPNTLGDYMARTLASKFVTQTRALNPAPAITPKIGIKPHLG